jgi:branched-chain amino acid transport system permease protein
MEGSDKLALPPRRVTMPVAGAGTRRLMLGLGAVALTIALAFVCRGYQLFQLTTVVSYSIAILGLNIVTGYNGQISLGHGAFYAIGAYVTAILISIYGVPYWATLPAAALVCAGFGFLIGFPALRLGSLYLALTTFAMAVALPQLLKYPPIGKWTGGVQGLVINKPNAPSFLPLSDDQWLYLFSVGVAVLMFVAAHNLLRGRIGRAMAAVRDHSLAAEAMGVNVALIKTGAFAVSALLTGVAGSIGAIAVRFVAPDSFSVFLSIMLFVGLVVGGVGSISGAIFGGLFIVLVPDIAEKLTNVAPSAVYGVILIVLVYLMPSGITGVVRRAATNRGR